MLGPNEVIISDLNWQEFVDPASQVVDGEHKAKGLVPRDYNLHPVGSYGSAVPYWAVQMKTVPRDQWSQRIKDKIAAKSQLSDIRMTGNNGQRIPSLDQNGQGFCATEDTEVLTEKGWVPYPEYNYEDLVATVNPLTHAMEFQKPFERHVYDYDGPMIYSTNRRIDFGVTPDHQMYVRKWDERKRTLSDSYSFVRAGDLGWYTGLLAAPSGQVGTELLELAVPGDREYSGDDLIALTSLICSDGYAGGSESTRNWVSFCCFDEKRYPKTRELALRNGFHEKTGQRGVFVRYDAGALANWIRENCYVREAPFRAQSKKVPELFKYASVRQIRHFLEWYGDRNHGENADPTFYSVSKRMIDDLQELHLRSGTRSTICERGPRTAVMRNGQTINGGPSYVLNVATTDRLCLDRKKHLTTEHYKGRVYCAAVPNHTLITRRNGSVLISSNCWMYSGTGCIMLLRAAMNQPYVRLSAHAGACIIKNYRDEGGWGAQGLDFLTSRGQPSVEFWPEKSMNRSNDNEATWANAALHKVTEGFVDLQAAQYDRNLTFEQVGTCLLLNIPVIGDYNHWGHSVALMDLVDGVNLFDNGLLRAASGKLITQQEFDIQWSMNDVGAGYGVRLLNSWSDNWSDQGQGILSGNKAIPNGATAPRVTIPSYTSAGDEPFSEPAQDC